MTCHRVSFVIVACLGTLLSCKGQENRANLASMPMDNTASSEFKAHTENASQDFIVFDGMHLRNKPAEIAEAGLVPVKIAYARPLFGEHSRQLRLSGSLELPPAQRVSRYANGIAEAGHQVVIIDIEHWPLTGEGARRSLDNYRTVLSWFRSELPNAQLGYYGVVPSRNDDLALQNRDSRGFREWREANDLFASLARSVDALFPTIYTRTRDRNEWARTAEVYIAEARRINPDVPVYVFLWPLYQMRGNAPIEEDYWRFQLETVHRLADGAVIWMGASYTWDPEAPWWEVTKEFMQELESSER